MTPKQSKIKKDPTFEVVYKPWGSYRIVEIKKGRLIKQIDVLPGEMLSLQSHIHRSELWIVVSGVACVRKGEEILSLGKNQSVFIPRKTKHRLANITDFPLRIIEIQYGDILDEEDIIRYDDLYGRC
jgi:mannose-1-phosphate guanylyltransferase/mannose-6-phosphate isomerase